MTTCSDACNAGVDMSHMSCANLTMCCAVYQCFDLEYTLLCMGMASAKLQRSQRELVAAMARRVHLSLAA